MSNQEGPSAPQEKPKGHSALDRGEGKSVIDLYNEDMHVDRWKSGQMTENGGAVRDAEEVPAQPTPTPEPQPDPETIDTRLEAAKKGPFVGDPLSANAPGAKADILRETAARIQSASAPAREPATTKKSVLTARERTVGTSRAEEVIDPNPPYTPQPKKQPQEKEPVTAPKSVLSARERISGTGKVSEAIDPNPPYTPRKKAEPKPKEPISAPKSVLTMKERLGFAPEAPAVSRTKTARTRKERVEPPALDTTPRPRATRAGERIEPTLDMTPRATSALAGETAPKGRRRIAAEVEPTLAQADTAKNAAPADESTSAILRRGLEKETAAKNAAKGESVSAILRRGMEKETAMRERMLSPQEKEALNRATSASAAMTERVKERAPGVFEKTVGLIEKYNKLHPGVRLAIAGTLLVAGAGAALYGGAIGAGAASAVMIASRITSFMGSYGLMNRLFGKKLEEKIGGKGRKGVLIGAAALYAAAVPQLFHWAGAELFGAAPVEAQGDGIVPAEKPGFTIPGAEGEVAVKKGDTVWALLKGKLMGSEEFAKLDPAQKTYVIDAYKDKLAAMNAEDIKKLGIGSGDINKIKVGEKLSFDSLFTDQELHDRAFRQAGNLSDAQKINILSYDPRSEMPPGNANVMRVSEGMGGGMEGPGTEEIAFADRAQEVAANSNRVTPNLEGESQMTDMRVVEELGAKDYREKISGIFGRKGFFGIGASDGWERYQSSLGWRSAKELMEGSPETLAKGTRVSADEVRALREYMADIMSKQQYPRDLYEAATIDKLMNNLTQGEAAPASRVIRVQPPEAGNVIG